MMMMMIMIMIIIIIIYYTLISMRNTAIYLAHNCPGRKRIRITNRTLY